MVGRDRDVRYCKQHNDGNCLITWKIGGPGTVPSARVPVCVSCSVPCFLCPPTSSRGRCFAQKKMNKICIYTDLHVRTPQCERGCVLCYRNERKREILCLWGSKRTGGKVRNTARTRRSCGVTYFLCWAAGGGVGMTS